MLFDTATALLGELTPTERSRMALPSGRNGAAYALYLEGASHLRAGDPASLAIAEQFFQRSVELDSTFADAHVGLGAITHARGFMGLSGGQRNFALAESHFFRAYELDSLSPLAMQGYAEVLNSKGRYRESLAIGMRSMRHRPRTLAHELVAGRIYAVILPEVGLRICKDILLEDPSDPAARFWAVIAAAFSGQIDEVQTQGGEFIRRFGEDMEIYMWMSLAALQGGDRQKALALARRCYEVEGDDADLRALLNLAEVEELALGPDAAREHYRKLLDIARERDRRDTRGVKVDLVAMVASAMLGDSASVVQRYETGEMDPGNPDYGMRLMIKIGRRDLARQAFELLDRRQLGVMQGPMRSLNHIEEELMASDDDPLVAEFLRKKAARHAALLAEFGNPWVAP
jgi:tetratricopeptide (TPR) repeat protein